MTGSRSGQARPATTRQVTIQDVAQAARVSRQTVSNVLNGSGRVGEAAKVRVRDAVAALGYQPNHGARSLRSRRTRQIAYVMPRVQLLPDNYIMQQFLQALAAASARQSYSMVIAVTDGASWGTLWPRTGLLPSAARRVTSAWWWPTPGRAGAWARL